jgi:hypothetical protein
LESSDEAHRQVIVRLVLNKTLLRTFLDFSPLPSLFVQENPTIHEAPISHLSDPESAS